MFTLYFPTMSNNGGSFNLWTSGDYRNYIQSMRTKFNKDFNRRRRQDHIFFNIIDEQEDITPLKVESVEFYAKDNAVSHHTDQFELVQDSPATPVLRRGQDFYMAIKFDREMDNTQDVIRLIFNFGPRPDINKRTKVILPLVEEEQLSEDKLKWDARIHGKTERTLSVQIQTPPTSPVGIWKLVIQTGLIENGRYIGKKDFRCKEDIYILFNPWCRDDTVFMEDEDLKKEYVLNDTGKVWMGSYRKPRGRRWIFGQFDDVVLPTTMYLLERSRLLHSDRGNAIQVSRAISAVINSNDDNGLLFGRWDGHYRDGVAPFDWTGTVDIMQRYLQSGFSSVKYGQCWVFTGAVVTVCRALGIPCRAVTNYVSAHDTNRSLTVDKYFRRNGEEIIGGPDGESRDSCWNFHVWADVWMSRPDLPTGYGGWQIIDSTPQERSENLFMCGPASIEAVKKGEVGFLYDTPFVFAEVNADVCHFQEDRESDWGFSRMRINQYHVGRKIVTKKVDMDDDVGDDDMDDITYEYKNPEGSQEERLAVFNAVRGVERAQQYYDFPKKHEEDVFFDLVEIDTVPFGEPFDVTMIVRNESNEERTVRAILSASSVYYTGVTAHRLKKSQSKLTLPPHHNETLQIHVPVEDYLGHIVDHGLIKLYAMANVAETKQTWSEEDDFPLLKPILNVEIENEPIVGQECLAIFSFQNPLSVPLTNCKFRVEGPGLQRPKLIDIEDVGPNEMMSFTEKFYPKKQGERKIVGVFNSKTLTDVTGSTTVMVSAN